MKSMALSEYFKIIHPEYVFFKLKPLKSIRNYNSDKIILAVASMYRSVFNRIQKINKKYFFNVEYKMAYYIFMEHGNIEFYFIIPKDFKLLLENKIKDTWSGVTIEEVDSIPNISTKSIKYTLGYEKRDVMSLATDKRNNILLSAICQNLSILEDGDKVGVFYNFVPANISNWRNDFDRAIESLQNGLPKEKTGHKAGLMIMLAIIEKSLSFLLEIFMDLFGEDSVKKDVMLKRELNLSSETYRKRDSKVVNTQIVVMSESKNLKRANNNAISVCESFKCISADNGLVYRNLNCKNILFTEPYVKNADRFIASSSECQNFLSLPARELIEEYNIDCVETIETEVPELLTHGYISLGVNTFRGHKQEAFLRDNYDQGNLPLVLVGEQGSGKSTYLANYINCIQKRNEGAIVIDFIKNCELANIIDKHIDKSRCVILDMTDFDCVQGIGYNELKPKSYNIMDRLDVANRKANYIQTLVDALNVNGEPLSSSMDRYLNAASNIVFLDDNASLQDVVRCLNDWQFRQKCVENITGSLKLILEDELNALEELNNYEGEKINGTKSIKIDGINHRINLLRKDLRLKMMFKKGCKDNLDFVKAMDDGKIIIVKMPQEYFGTPYSKNVLVTYLLTKIWTAELIRGSRENKPKRFHVIVDEIFQTKTAMQLLRDQEILPQTRKFGCKFVFSCQYLKQIDVINQTLRSAGASYMLMKGTGKANFNEFKDELYPYTLDDIENLKQYHSLNIINYEQGRKKFITELPRPL